MSIDVIIPNYNGFDLLSENLLKVVEAIRKYEGRIIIIDDFSEREEFEKLRRLVDGLIKDKVRMVLLRNEKNLGFSSTINRGVRESDADLVIFLNTDVAPAENFLDPVIEDFNLNNNLFGVGCMDRSIEGEKIILRGRGLARFDKGFLVHERGEVDKTDTFWISGGSSIVRRELFTRLGGLDTLYDPFYWEDIDLSYRARKSGFKIKFEAKSIVEHRHTQGSIKKHYSDFQIKTIAYRNQFIFVWKNITDLNLFASHLFWLPYHLLTSVLRLDVPLFLGFLLALISLPAIIRGRSEQKKLYRVRDSDLLNAS